MSERNERNKQVYRDCFSCIERGDLDDLDLYLASDYRTHASPDAPPGPEGERQVVSAFKGSFPDIRFAIETLVAVDDTVAAVSRVSGTHHGEFMGLAPTGKRFEVLSADWVRIEKGKIAEHRGVFQTSHLVQQLSYGDPTTLEICDAHEATYRSFVACLQTEGMAHLERYVAPDFILHSFDASRGPDGERQVIAKFKSAFPDCGYKLETLFSDGDLLAAVVRVTGTHHGDYLGAEATGRSFDVRSIQMARLQDGKVQEQWEVFDKDLMLEHLGIGLTGPPRAHGI